MYISPAISGTTAVSLTGDLRDAVIGIQQAYVQLDHQLQEMYIHRRSDKHLGPTFGPQI